MPALALAILSIFFLGGVQAQSLNNEQIEGLCIFKLRSEAPDSEATIFEYRSTVAYRSATYLFPVSSPKIRIPPSAEFHCIPYPGRSDLDQRTALTLVGLGKTRFPQFEKILTQLEKGWKSVDPKTINTAGPVQRHFLAVESIKKMASPRSDRLPAPVIKASVLPTAQLKTSPLLPSAPKGSGAPVSRPNPAAVDEPSPVPASDPDSLKKNLDVIKSAYGTASQLLEKQPMEE
jgi:hypothetical protein